MFEMRPKIGGTTHCVQKGGSSLSLLKMRRTMIYIPNPSTDLKGQASQQNEYDQGGFQLEFVSISWVINHMTSYNSSALIG